LPNPTPGEILQHEFLAPAKLAAADLARALHMPARRLADIVKGRRALDADADLRLARYFRMSPGFFLGLQADYDLMQKRRELGADLDAIKPRAA
jgi:addiction module HigA family antidote